MKEKIYTIPVTEAFKVECECPMCVLEKKLEDESIDYVLGPFLMEPDGREETNAKGFCKTHYEKLYNRGVNRLGLGLILDTHLVDQNEKLKKIYYGKMEGIKKDAEASLMKNLSNKLSSKHTETEKFLTEMITKLTELSTSCTVCNKLQNTMDRYTDVILYLWQKEDSFRNLLNNNKGFCLKHLKQLLECAQKTLSVKEAAQFIQVLMELQMKNMERIQEEVNWFTKKFDYRYSDAPWGNSKDSVIRSIQKIAGQCDLK